MSVTPFPPLRARLKPLADLVEGCLDKALAAQGFAGADIIVSWADIVGERLARVSQPLKMDWPRRNAAGRDGRSEPATLVVRVEGAFAIELQHTAPLIVERVNAHYGWRCVGRLTLKQGPVRRAAVAREPDRVLSDSEQAHLRAVTEAVAEEPLRQALRRLGAAVALDTVREPVGGSR